MNKYIIFTSIFGEHVFEEVRPQPGNWSPNTYMYEVHTGDWYLRHQMLETNIKGNKKILYKRPMPNWIPVDINRVPKKYRTKSLLMT